ncbi:hypothetical protein WKW80_05260 [Variovorax humicola]|uniref:Uncharacterized protein n=1 Tax=Variovorax humicola TaxID=1769758 RepID=A0ABU8VUG2_9BURK
MDISAPSALADLKKLDDYQQCTSHIFPGCQSIRWYVRQHRDALARSGALLTIAGRLWVHAPKFDRCVLEIGAGGAV